MAGASIVTARTPDTIAAQQVDELAALDLQVVRRATVSHRPRSYGKISGVSLGTGTSSLLTIAPQVWWEHGALHVKTSRVLQVLGLGSFARHVVVDPQMKRLEINTRKLWFLGGTRIVAFDEIAYLLYEFKSLGTDWTAGLDRADQLESFRIGIGLHTREELPLASFRGEGSVTTGGVGVALGDDVLDLQGNQEGRSLDLLEVLQKCTGAPLGRPLLERGAIRVCGTCGRAAADDALRCSCGGTWKVIR